MKKGNGKEEVTMENGETRSRDRSNEERIIRVQTLDDFDRELARDGGETLEVPAWMAEEYGLFPEDVGSEDDIRGGGEPEPGRGAEGSD